MYFKHASKIWSQFPSLSAGVISLQNIQSGINTQHLVADAYANVHAFLKNTAVADLPSIAAWRNVYSQMGYKPTQYRCAAESLLRRFSKDHSLPSFHPVVDICNAFSLQYGIPIAVIDADHIVGGIEVQSAIGDEEYLNFSDKSEQPDIGEIVFLDEANHAHSRRWCYRQSKKSVVTSATQNILIVAEAHHEGAQIDITNLLHELCTALANFGEIGTMQILTAIQPECVFAVNVPTRATLQQYKKVSDLEQLQEVSSTGKRVLSGMQPSGRLHLGNYFGSMKPNLLASTTVKESLFFIADLHSLTTIHNKELLHSLRINALKDYLAVGFEPTVTTMFYQSDVPEHTQLMWILSCVCPKGLLDRSVSFKDKEAKGLAVNAGLYTYPILMAADILLYNIEQVPVGKDQKQHVEIARDIATKFNNQFGETLVLPEPVIQESVAVVPGIDGQKMSKSYGNTVPLFMAPAEAKKVIMSILTDSSDKNDPKDPETCTIYQIHKHLLNKEAAANLAAEYKNGLPYGEAKQRLLATYNEFFAPLNEARNKLSDDYILEVAAAGAKKARDYAHVTLSKVHTAIGL